jgi:hypothetical protein
VLHFLIDETDTKNLVNSILLEIVLLGDTTYMDFRKDCKLKYKKMYLLSLAFFLYIPIPTEGKFSFISFLI